MWGGEIRRKGVGARPRSASAAGCRPDVSHEGLSNSKKWSPIRKLRSVLGRFRVLRHLARIDPKRGDHFRYADFAGLIPLGKPDINHALVSIVLPGAVHKFPMQMISSFRPFAPMCVCRLIAHSGQNNP